MPLTYHPRRRVTAMLCLLALLKFLGRTANTPLLLLAIFTIILAIATANKGLQLAPKFNSPDRSIERRIDFSRGGLWIMSLHEHFSPPRVYISNNPRSDWTITRTDSGWQDRLKPAQTGPFYCGFCFRSQHFGSVDGPIWQGENAAVVADGSLMRLPLQAIIAALLAFPILRWVSTFRRRCRVRSPRDLRSLVASVWRRLFTFAAATSALLLALALWQCIRTQSVDRYAGWRSSWNTFSPTLYHSESEREFVVSSAGWQFTRSFKFTSLPAVAAVNEPLAWFGYGDSSFVPRNSAPSQRSFGFAFTRISDPPFSVDPTRHGGWSILIPHWAIVLTSAILPCLWLYRLKPRYRRALRLRQGLCLNCGYDLRASPTRCPECGTQTPIKVPPA